MKHSKRSVFNIYSIITVFPLLLLYFLTAMPTPGVRDNPEFLTSAQTLGVAHPPGFPVYSSMTKIFTYIPFGNIALDVSLSSSIYATISLLFLFLSVRAISLYIFKTPSDNSSAILSAIIVTMSLGISGTFWTTAIEQEVYTLNILFLSATWFFGIVWCTGKSDAWLYAGSFCFGLSSGNHGSVALYMPGLLIFFLASSKKDTLKRLLYVLFFFFIGFSIYVFLPVRAVVDPPMNFGNPDTLDRFISHITDRKDRDTHFASAVNQFGGKSTFWFFVNNSFGVLYWLIGFPFTLIGLYRMFKEHKPLLIGLVYTILMNYFFFSGWYRMPIAFLPTFLWLSLFTGIGLVTFFQKLNTPPKVFNKKYFYFSVIIIFCIFFSMILIQYNDRSRSNSHIFFESFTDDYLNTPPDSIILTTRFWFSYIAFQDIYRLREDNSVLTSSDLLGPRYFNPISNNRFPRIRIPKSLDVNDGGLSLVANFIYENVKNFDQYLFVESSPLLENFYDNLIPTNGFLCQFTPDPIERWPGADVDKNVEYLIDKLSREFTGNIQYLPQMEDYYGSGLIFLSTLMNKHKQYDQSIKLLKSSGRIFWQGERSFANNNQESAFASQIGVTYLLLNSPDKAENYFERALNSYPDSWANWVYMGQVYLLQGHLQEARKLFQYAAHLAPREAGPYFFLGELYRQLGNRQLAIKNYQTAVKLIGPGNRFNDNARKILQELKNSKSTNLIDEKQR